MTRVLLRALALLAAALAAAACTTLAPLPPTPLAGDECTRWFAQLDAAVDAAGVRDAQDERVPGFAFVRVDRLAVASRETLPLPQWLARVASLDEQARAAEVANLPAASFPIDGAADSTAAGARSQACRDSLMQRVQQDSALQRTLQSRAAVPDRYDVSLRALGAYPLLRWPFFAGVQTWQSEHTRAVARWDAQPPPRLRFDPPADDADAPVFEIELRQGQAPPYDRFGAPMWSARDAAAPSLDTAQPVVYRRSTQSMVDGRWLQQRVYTLWFAERPAGSAFDLLSGTLDGVIVRLTLADDGTPLIVDSIHACGCWHQFYPAPGVSVRDGAPAGVEWAFVPAGLPPLQPGQRLAVRLASGTHHVTGVATPSPLPAERYMLRDENELRMLPLPGGAGSRSLYGSDGLVRGSERGERFLFWPMGIASAGAMRQWGHHATAFVGRRHFDDPNLLVKRFNLPASPTP